MTRIAFIGSAGIPNRYGGFEAFLEQCAPAIVAMGHPVTVTCDAALYSDQKTDYLGVKRVFLAIRANGASSMLHDALAFLRVWRQSDAIVILGVSAGPWFPLFRIACSLTRRRLVVNIDGVEWRREKFGRFKRLVLRVFDRLAQWSAHSVIYDNAALAKFVADGCVRKSHCIGYPGDHVLRLPHVQCESATALTVCRIEPENNLELLIVGALSSNLRTYTIVGNWGHSEFSRSLLKQYKHEPRLRLLEPIYDPQKLAVLREQTALYLHGHSVGGTNPSLVEMLFYDTHLLCKDVPFNRETAGEAAQYFGGTDDLRRLINKSLTSFRPSNRVESRGHYTARRVAQRYVEVATGLSSLSSEDSTTDFRQGPPAPP